MLAFFLKLHYNDKAFRCCRSGGMADATDSKSVGSDTVWVQVPPSAPNRNNTNPEQSRFVFFFTRDYFGIQIPR